MNSESENSSLKLELVQHLYRQRAFSKATFGPGQRTEGVLDHAIKEIEEIREKPDDLEEWIDLILLAFDGAWRAGFTPEEIVKMILFKQGKNEDRVWPDWRSADQSKAIEHVKNETITN